MATNSTKQVKITLPRIWIDVIEVWAERAGVRPTQFMSMAVVAGARQVAQGLNIYSERDDSFVREYEEIPVEG